MPGSLSQHPVCHGGATCAIQRECIGENKDHGKNSLVICHRRWDAASGDKWRCFKGGEKKKMLSSEDKCVADCTVMGFMSQSFPNPRKQGNENLFSFGTICFLRQRKIRALYSDNEGPSLQNTQINQKMICFKDQVSYSRNLRCRHLLAVRILKLPARHRMGASDRPAAGAVLHRKKET